MSDLLIGGDGTRHATALVEELRTYNHAGQIDYVVITGNLTNDGSEKSFIAANEFVRKLAQVLLREERGGQRLSRVLIVPGPNDVRASGSFKEFRDFHDDLFAKEIEGERMERFNENEVVFRQLKDLLLFGITYWQPRPDDAVRPSLRDVDAAVERARQRALELTYTRRVPALIASAENIASDGDGAEIKLARKIQKQLRTLFDRGMQLFGNGPVSASLTWAGEFHHLGFGTGVRPAGSFWPATMNLLRIDKDALRPDNRSRARFLSNTVYQRRSAEAPLAPLDCLNGQLDGFFPPDECQRAALYAPLLEILEREFTPRSNRYVVFTGFPGAGRRTFFDYLRKRRKLVTKDVFVMAIALRNYAEFKKQLEIEMAAYKKAATTAMPIVVIHDLVMATRRTEQRAELKEIVKNNDPCTVMPELGGVLLLLPNVDFTLGAERDHNVRVEPLLPLNEAPRKLVHEYADRVPAGESDVRNLAGGYVGFSEMLLEAASKTFGRRPGAHPVSGGTATEVLEEALASQSVVDESHWHRESLAEHTGGRELCQYVDEQVRQCIAEQPKGRSLVSVPPVRIHVEQLRRGSRAPAVIDDLLKKLNEAGVLVQESAGVYTVAAMAPFVAPQKPLVVEKEWQPPLDKNDFTSAADILIITPMAEEREALLGKLPGHQKLDMDEEDIQVYYMAKVPYATPQGRKGTYRVVVTDLIGIGQENAGLAANRAITRWKPRVVLLVGIAGGVRAGHVALGDVVIAQQIGNPDVRSETEAGTVPRWQGMQVDAALLAVAHNFPMDQALQLMSREHPTGGRPRPHIDPIVSGNAVVSNEKLLDEYRKTYPRLIGIEMEAWGVASAAFQSAIPKRFFMIRGVSDLADKDKNAQQEAGFREYACDVAASYTIALLRSGPIVVKETQPRATDRTEARY